MGSTSASYQMLEEEPDLCVGSSHSYIDPENSEHICKIVAEALMQAENYFGKEDRCFESIEVIEAGNMKENMHGNIVRLQRKDRTINIFFSRDNRRLVWYS